MFASSEPITWPGLCGYSGIPRRDGLTDRLNVLLSRRRGMARSSDRSWVPLLKSEELQIQSHTLSKEGKKIKQVVSAEARQLSTWLWVFTHRSRLKQPESETGSRPAFLWKRRRTDQGTQGRCSGSTLTLRSAGASVTSQANVRVVYTDLPPRVYLLPACFLSCRA